MQNTTAPAIITKDDVTAERLVRQMLEVAKAQTELDKDFDRELRQLDGSTADNYEARLQPLTDEGNVIRKMFEESPVTEDELRQEINRIAGTNDTLNVQLSRNFGITPTPASTD